MRFLSRCLHLERGGQSLTETVLLLPVFLFFAFGLLQVAQIGVGLLAANYAASSVARKAANEQSFAVTSVVTPAPIVQSYKLKAASLMVAGVGVDDIFGCVMKDPNDPTAELEVAVRTKVQAWPFFGDIVHDALQSTYSDSSALTCPGLGSANSFGPFNFSSGSPPYFFYVTGKAKVRLNYVS